ncbi:MAG TPA: SRPBCC family protein [Luteimicrobium sp.]|nr:SRPBCC family protein [Luteimicrobium sp.]
MPSELVVVTRTRHATERLFDLALDVDAHVRSMPGTGERAVAGVTSGRIGLGETVTWQGRHLGVRFTLTARVVELERPHRFVDVQVTGPFRSFAHEHVFAREGGETVMTDRVVVASPVFGRVAERLVLVPYLRRLLRRRGRLLVDALDAGS